MGFEADIMASSSTFIAYIDESGDEGFQFDAGSSSWFVLSCIVLRCAVELQEVKLVDEVRTLLNAKRQPQHRIPDKKPLHFRDLPHEQRKMYAQRVGGADLQALNVLIHKPDLASPEKFTDGSRLYFFAVRLLVERLSWYCRDHKRKDDAGDGSVEIVFSNRASMDYDELRKYLEYLDTNRIALDYKAEPGVIRSDRIATYTHGKRMGLQIADAVASGFFYAVEPSPYGLTEDGYARLLLPRVYRHQKQLWGYGVKIFPRETEEKRRKGEVLPGWK
jgi:hypothetical protein